MLADNWDRGSLYSYRAFSFPSEMPYEAITQPVMFITGEKDGALTKGAKKVPAAFALQSGCCHGCVTESTDIIGQTCMYFHLWACSSFLWNMDVLMAQKEPAGCQSHTPGWVTLPVLAGMLHLHESTVHGLACNQGSQGAVVGNTCDIDADCLAYEYSSLAMWLILCSKSLCKTCRSHV